MTRNKKYFINDILKQIKLKVCGGFTATYSEHSTFSLIPYRHGKDK